MSARPDEIAVKLEPIQQLNIGDKVLYCNDCNTIFYGEPKPCISCKSNNINIQGTILSNVDDNGYSFVQLIGTNLG